MLAKRRGLLYVSGMTEPFAEIPLTPELRKLEGRIIECHFDMKQNCWRFMRERTDKSFPNHKTTAIGKNTSILPRSPKLSIQDQKREKHQQD
jgi:hypothetical protein